jgi:uncharacterized protein (DUF1778 family)
MYTLTMAASEPVRKHERFDLRATPTQAAVIREAARETHRTVTDFVMETAFEEARRVLADSSTFALKGREWRIFNEILDRPATVKPRLAALLNPETPTAQ